MILPLTRPLISLDCETHDFCEPEKARIVELGFKVMYPVETAREPLLWVSYLRPDLLISDKAIEVHKITNKTVMGCSVCGGDEVEHTNDHLFEPWPTFKSIAANLARGFTNCDFCGYHVRYDLRVIAAEFERADVLWSQGDARLLDSMHMWRIIQPRTLGDAVRTFLKREPTEAHRALGDAEDALEVALAQIEGYPDLLPPDLQKLFELCFDMNNVDPDGKLKWGGDGEITITFGKYKDVSLRRVMAIDRQYLTKFMLEKGDFSQDVKRVIRNALVGIFPVRSGAADEETPF